MVSTVKGNSIPRATTLERDANFTSVPDGFSFFNTTNNRIEVTNDGGSTWNALSHLQDLNNFDLQDAYDNGDGKINYTVGKPINIVGINNLDPAKTIYNTPSAGGIAAEIQMDGENISSSPVTYGNIICNMTDVTAGLENGSITFGVVDSGALQTFLEIDGTLGSINLEKNIRGQNNDIFDVDRVACSTLGVGLSNPSGTVATFLSTDQYRIQFEDTSNIVDFANLQTPAVGQSLFKLNFAQGTSETPDYAEIEVKTESIGVGTEDGSITFRTLSSGTLTSYMTIDGVNDEVAISSNASVSGNITVSSLSANSLVISDGTQTLASGDLSGDVTTSGGLATTLATVNSNVGTFGDASNVAQVTVNAKGLVTAVTDVPISGGGSLTRQDTYDNGSSITVTAGNPIEFTSATTDPRIEFYRQDTDTFPANIGFYGNDSLAAKQEYGVIETFMSDSTSGSISMDMNLIVKSSGANAGISILGVAGRVSTTFTTSTTSPTTGSLVNSGGFGNAGDIRNGGDIYTEGADFSFVGDVVSASYVPNNLKRVIANDAFDVGAPLTASTVVDFRVVSIPTGVSLTTPVIGFAHTASTGAGDEVLIAAAEIITLVSDGSAGGIDLGDVIEKSNSTSYRSESGAVGAGTFAETAEDVGANTTFRAWLIHNLQQQGAY